jgi:hypothetical protein
MKLHGRLVAAAEVSAPGRRAMFELMDRHYENVRRDVFEADLDDKQWVIQVHDPATGALAGFSTQRLIEAEVDGRPVTALFSGDTIIDREHWGDSALAHVWGRLALSLIDATPGDRLYWFLISKGYKTYRYLPLFFHEFYPHPERPTPAAVQAVVDALAGLRYPADYDPSRGVVRAGPGKDRLRPGIADLTDGRLQDCHVRFFAECNPGHAEGDELCCLAPLTRANFTRAAWRVIGTTPAPACAGS